MSALPPKADIRERGRHVSGRLTLPLPVALALTVLNQLGSLAAVLHLIGKQSYCVAEMS
jgi:hypothetical protein